MVKLIKYFNENYGQQYGNVEYPRTKKEIYQTYQIIKAYGIKDDTLLDLLNKVVLPKPTSIKEREMYSECLYEVGKETLPKLSEFENDLYYYKRTPFLKITKDDFAFVIKAPFSLRTLISLSLLISVSITSSSVGVLKVIISPKNEKYYY